MNKKLEQIEAKKKKLIKDITQANVELLVVVYKAILNDTPIRKVHKEIRKVLTLQAKNEIPYIEKREIYALDLVRRGKKLSNVFLPFVWFERKEHAWQKMNFIGFEYAREYEAKEKEKVLKEFEDETKKGNDKVVKRIHEVSEDNEEAKKEEEIKLQIFYLASKHGDCAEDHLEYQGKIYVIKDWEKYTQLQEVKDYIKANNIETFEWVIGKPVWLITRPNCRHYFERLTIKEVLGSSVDTLLKNHKMIRRTGRRRDLQTLKHSTHNAWYTKENVENIIDKYQDRLDYHEELYRVKNEDIIRQAIEKDKLLIKKWKDFLQTF